MGKETVEDDGLVVRGDGDKMGRVYRESEERKKSENEKLGDK